MAIRPVQVDGREYLFSPDDKTPLSSRLWGLLRGRLVDDVTLQPIQGNIRLESDLPGSFPRIMKNGFIGLVGIPREIFPILAAKSYRVNLTIHAAGHASRVISIVIPNRQTITAIPFPVAGDNSVTVENTSNLLVGETLMIGNPVTHPGSKFEQVQIAAIGPGFKVVLRHPFIVDHHLAAEPVVPVIPADFRPIDFGDVHLVPQP